MPPPAARPALAVALRVTSAMDVGRLTAELLVRLYEEVQTRLTWATRLREELRRWQPEITLGPVRASRRTPLRQEAHPDLYRELRRLWHDHLAEHVAGVVILLDDVHQLLVHDATALLTLRGAFQDLQGAGARYPLVVTGPDGLLESVRDASEPVTRFFERMLLGPFSLEDTREAVRAPLRAVGSTLEVEESAVEVVWRLTEGHPFFVTFVMRDLVHQATAQRTRRISASDVEAFWPMIAEHLAAERFSVDWQSATPAEREVLVTLARGEDDAPITRAVGRSGTALLVRLLRKGLVVRSGRGEYRLYHPLFQGFVLQRSRSDNPPTAGT